MFNTGTLDISYGSGVINFATESGGPAGVSSVTGDIMYADVTIVVEDSRAEGARDGYSIALSVSRPESGAHYIDLANLSITGVSGLPEGDSMTLGFRGDAASLTQSVTVVRVGDHPSSTSYTITVHITMVVPAGTAPGDYTSNLRLDTSPADNGLAG